MYKPLPPEAPRCQHIHDDNARCGSPALRGQPFCYWHSNARAVARKKTVTVPVLDNPASIQLGLTQVISRLVAGDLDPKVATIAINGLRIASVNQKHMKIEWSLAENELTPAMAAELLAAEESTEFQVEYKVDGAPYLPSVGRCGVPTASTRPDTSADATNSDGGRCGIPTTPDHPSTTAPDHQMKNGPMAPSPDGAIPLTPMLSNTKVKALKRIMRQGPRHPLFKSAARQLEKHGAAVVDAQNLEACGD